MVTIETTTFPVIVHEFPGRKAGVVGHAYELVVPLTSSLSSQQKKNALVFVGGLTDGPHTNSYIRTIAKHVAGQEALDYSVFEIRMFSSFSGFGFSNLERDVADIAAIVNYLKTPAAQGGAGRYKVVLMGHSTGCQDCIAYSDFEKYTVERPEVDGYILQGPVSDREAIGKQAGEVGVENKLKETLELAERMIKEGNGREIMPSDNLPGGVFFTTPISAYRWWSLGAVGGDDDFFSSDLPDETLARIWGRLKSPILIVPSGADEHVPTSIDVLQMMKRWKSFCKKGIASELSDLIPGASHAVKQADAQAWLAERITRFLKYDVAKWNPRI